MSANLLVVNGSSTVTGHNNLLDIKVDEIIANTGIFPNLVVGTGTFTTIVVGTGIFNNIIAGTGTFTNLIASSGIFQNLTVVNPIQAMAGIRGIYNSRTVATGSITASGTFQTQNLDTQSTVSGMNDMTYTNSHFNIANTGIYFGVGNLSYPVHANMNNGRAGVGFDINGGLGQFANYCTCTANDIALNAGPVVTSCFTQLLSPGDVVGLQGFQTYTSASVAPAGYMSIGLLNKL